MKTDKDLERYEDVTPKELEFIPKISLPKVIEYILIGLFKRLRGVISA